MEILLLLALPVAAVAGYLIYQRRRPPVGAAGQGKRPRDAVDTVAGWPPEATRLLTASERAAHETLVKALPECMIFSQVPLARFIRVPRRQSYAEWLERVGHMSVDFLICDRASLVIGTVSLQTAQDNERSVRRRARMARVLKAAGIKVFVWREQAIPTAANAREQIMQRTGALNVPPPSLAAGAAQAPRSAGANGKIPVPEVLSEVSDDGPRFAPPSTWYDELDSGPTPLDPARRQGKP